MVKQAAKFRRAKDLFLRHFQMAQLSSSAAVLAYYTLLSLFPAVLVVGSFLPALGLDANTALAYLKTAVPISIYKFIRPIVYDFLQRGSGGILTTGSLVALWSTSQGIAAFQQSVNRVYGMAKNQNTIVNRVLSFIWMVLVTIILFALVIVYGLGEQVMKFLQPVLGYPMEYVYLFRSLRWPIAFVGIFAVFTLFYYFVPSAQVRLRYVIGGALVVTVSWMGMSRLFSYYIFFFARRVISYGTIGAFIIMMVWFDFSGMLMILGAIINATLQTLNEGKIRPRHYFWHTAKKKSQHDN